MPKPFANSAQITYSLVNGDWLLGIQTGNSTGDAGLPQMKHIKLSQLSDWVRGTYGQIWKYRGEFSASLPSDPQFNDYFLATATFTVDSVTYTKDHLYAYNASGTWDDISDVLSQYASQAQVTDIDDRLTAAEEKIDSMGDGIVYKGKVATYADLAGIVDPQRGWEYYVTGDAAFYVYNGASWDPIDNGIVQTITDGDTAHAPSADAVHDALASEASARESADSNLKDAIDATNARVENLEQEHGGYVTVNYRGTDAVPTGKAKYGLVESIVGKSRAWNQLIPDNKITITFTVPADVTTNTWGDSILSVSSLGIPTGHKVLAYTTSHNSKFFIGYAANGADFVTGTSYSESAPLAGTYELSSTLNGTSLYVRLLAGLQAGTYSCDIYLRDLTPIFPEGVPATVAEAVALCPSILEYDAYGYSIVDTVVEGVKSVGVNIWNGEKEVGNINGVNGQNTPNNDVYRSVGYIKVEPNTDYYFYNSTAGNTAGTLFFYDYNKNYITLANNSRNTKVPTPPNCYYIRMAILIESFGTGVQICLDSYSDKTTYHPYMTDTLSLSSPVTLRSAGSVAEEYDLDTGKVSHPVGNVQSLASLSWEQRTGTTKTFQTSDLSSVIKAMTDVGAIANLANAKYLPVSRGTQSTEADDKTIAVTSTGLLCICDSELSLSNISTKLANLELNYELATPDDPTQLTPVINNTIQTEGGGTINTIQDNVYPDDSPAPTIDNCLDVGYLAL